MAKKSKSNPPRRSNLNPITSGSMELIDVSVAGATFTGGALRLIPSFQAGSRLDILASQYSQYNIISSVVQYKTVTTTNTSGRVALAWSFDLKDPDPQSVAQIIQTARSRDDVPWKNFQSRCPRRPAEKRRYAYIDSASYVLLSLADQQAYTPASVIFGVDSSQQNGLLVGKLIWHYKIQFFNPNFAPATTTPNLFHMLKTVSLEDEEYESASTMPPNTPAAPSNT